MVTRMMKWVTGLVAVASLAAADEPIQALERIEVRAGDGGAQFVLADSGTPYFVKGFNYVRLRGDHATFDADTESTPAHYDPDRAEAMFRALSKAGYNTVRVFVIGRSKANPGIAGDYDTTKALHTPYMENVLDFLRRATRHRIRVFPTFGDGGVPLNAHYREKLPGKGHNKNVFVLTKEGIDSRIEHITSFLSYIKAREPALLPTLLGLQCQNEAYLRASQWPFAMGEGTFTAANGKSYDLAASDQRQALMDEGYRYYHERIAAAVKAIDPAMLVAEGVFVPRAVGKNEKDHAGVWPGKTKDERYPPMLTRIGRGALDFLDVHFYRANGDESVDEAFRLNLASPEAGKMRFCIEYCNSPDFSARGEEEWAACIAPWVEAMKHPSYLRIDGRLVFKVHGVTEFLKANDRDLDLCRQRLDTLRAAVRDAGLGEMIIGVGISGQTPPLGPKWPPAQLFDFTGTYMCVPEAEEREPEHPYATLAVQARTTRRNRLSDPLPWMPYLAAGWNPRPWTYAKAPPHYQRFFAFPTRAEFTRELQSMKKALSQHPSLGLPNKDGSTRKAFTIYAWNEFGEGGIVAPSRERGHLMLQCIRDVFRGGDALEPSARMK